MWNRLFMCVLLLVTFTSCNSTVDTTLSSTIAVRVTPSLDSPIKDASTPGIHFHLQHRSTTTSTTTPTFGWPRIPLTPEFASYLEVPYTGPVPSWTPQPTAAVRKVYRLRPWNPDLASDLIKVMDEYPKNLTLDQRGYLDSSYESSFRFAAIAEAEAAYRFPTSPQAREWEVASLYNRLRSFKPNLGVEYVKLIVDSLNNGETDVEALPDWFSALAQPLRLELLKSEPPRDYSLSHILFINPWGAGLNGGLYIWLLQKDNQFVAYPLASAQEIILGDGDVSLDLVDLTGDGVPEAVVRHVDWGSFSFHSGSLEVFDLTRAPPKKLQFNPSPDSSEIAKWLPALPTQGFPGIIMQIPFAIESGGCGLFGPTWVYRWTGKIFALEYINPPIQEEMEADPSCADAMLSWFLINLAKDGNISAAQLLEQLLVDYPRIDSDGEQISRDQLRYELAIALAYHGKVDDAGAQMNEIIVGTGDIPTIWSEAASKFLTAYQSDADLLEACLLVKKCSSVLGVEHLVSLIDPADFPAILVILNQLGLETDQSGAFDFDRDGQPEYWLYEYHPPDLRLWPFWIFSLSEGSIRSLLAAYPNIQTEQPNVQIKWEGTVNGFFQYKVVSDPSEPDGDEFFYWNLSVQPNVQPNEDSYEAITRIFTDLLTNEISPQTALQQMEDLRNRFAPCTNYVIEKFGCEMDKYLLYVTALAYEMAGQSEEAALRYWQLWQQDPQSPYAIMASAKLEMLP